MFKSIFLAAALTFGVAAGAVGSSPTIPDQRITGGEGILALGEAIELSLTPIKNPPTDFTAATYLWTVQDADGSEKSTREFTDPETLGGSTIVFGSGLKPKKMKVIVYASYLFLTKEGDKITQVNVKATKITTELLVGNPTPPPDPTPVVPTPPLPDPNAPIFPAGKFGLSKTTYDLVIAKVPAEERKAGGQALAKTYAGVASAIAAGGLKDQTEILKQTATLVKNALDVAGSSQDKWKPFFTDFQGVVFRLAVKNNAAGTSVYAWTPEDFSAAWNEISLGFAQVK